MQMQIKFQIHLHLESTRTSAIGPFLPAKRQVSNFTRSCYRCGKKCKHRNASSRRTAKIRKELKCSWRKPEAFCFCLRETRQFVCVSCCCNLPFALLFFENEIEQHKLVPEEIPLCFRTCTQWPPWRFACSPPSSLWWLWYCDHLSFFLSFFFPPSLFFSLLSFLVDFLFFLPSSSFSTPFPDCVCDMARVHPHLRWPAFAGRIGRKKKQKKKRKEKKKERG